MSERCDVPPPGWACSRAKGHEGPCAATPTAQSDVPAVLDEDVQIFVNALELRDSWDLVRGLLESFIAARVGPDENGVPFRPRYPVQVAFDPKAPALIGKLPEHWDERRAREGKPDASRCAADLRVAVDFTVHELRRAAHALQHDHEGDEYGLGMGRGLLHAANLISGDMTIAEAFAPKP
jgi:hypothetical protein